MTSTSGKRAVVRPYNPTLDFEDIVNICSVTAHPSIHLVADVLPYIYAIPYINLEPETSFVLDTSGWEPSPNNRQQPGRVVGYIIGTANTQEFVERFRTEYLMSMDFPNAISLEDSSRSPEESQLRNTFLRILNEPEGMLHAKNPGFLEQYPAHLHIDILPSHQRQGYGGTLITEFLKGLQKREVKGVHLGMRADNTLAGNFYKKHGFEEFADIKMDGTIWMAKELKPSQTDGN